MKTDAPWRPTELEFLRAHSGEGIAAIAKELGRTEYSVRGRARREAAWVFRSQQPARRWNPAELNFIATHHQTHTIQWLADQLGRPRHSVKYQLQHRRWLKFKGRRLRRRRIQLPDGMKLCHRCERVLPITDFSRGQGRCKRCSVYTSLEWNRRNTARFQRISKRSRLRRAYGLSEEELDRLTDDAAVCGICGKTGRLKVDHDHATGKVRGLLCHACNTGLGALGDSIEGLARATLYLTNTEQR